MAAEKLTALQVKRAGSGVHGDGKGLWLTVSKTGARSWLFRYMIDGRAREMGLGSAYHVSLSEARNRARKAHATIEQGVDPIEERNAHKLAARLERARSMTFRQCAEAYIATHMVKWVPKHTRMWENSLRDYAFPTLGTLPVQTIDVALAIKALRPVWNEKPITADRVRNRCEAILAWATASKFRTGDNPFAWEGLKHLLPNVGEVHDVEHFEAIRYEEIPAFMAQLRGHDGVVARALEATILLTARTGEVIGAKWKEFDAGIWTLPAERRRKLGKSAKTDLRVPLSKRMIDILNALPRIAGNEFVFVGDRPGRSISPSAMLSLMRRLHPTATVHGTSRAGFKSWASDRTKFSREVVEWQLGHVIGNRVEQAYQRADFLPQRRALAEQWARYCGEPAPDDNVVSLAAGAGR